MNLRLHMGWLGALEAGLIALAVGVVAWLLWQAIARRAGLPERIAIGWACVSAVVIASGLDSWNLFTLGVMRLESPLYARLALAKMHDPNFLGARVVLEWMGALSGVVAGWCLVRRPQADAAQQASPGGD